MQVSSNVFKLLTLVLCFLAIPVMKSIYAVSKVENSKLLHAVNIPLKIVDTKYH